MKSSILSLCAAAGLAAALNAAPVFAGSGHDHGPKYGGVVRELHNVAYELVAKPDSLTLYVSDHGKPIATEGAQAEAVIYAGHLCNVYGLDTISAGATIALACELFERGVLTAADTGGLEIRYGDAAMIHRLLGMMANREGFGAQLADGSYALAERFGVPELAVTVNKLEVPMHDPRAFSGMAAVYALSPRGACHMQGDMYGVDTGQGPAYELDITPGERFESSEEKGRVAARQQAWRTLYNAMILCEFQNPGVERVLAALNAMWSTTDATALCVRK